MRITYVHGKRKSRDEIILGHCNNVDYQNYLQEDSMIWEDEAYKNIAAEVNAQRKNVSEIIIRFDDFWKKLSTINKIVVYGHSLSEVDTPYFSEIVKHASKNAQWFFSVYNKKKETEIKSKNSLRI